MNIKTTVTPGLVPASWAASITLGYFMPPSGDNAVEMIPCNKTVMQDQLVTLRGMNEQLSLNFQSAALIAGQTSWINVIWTESPV
jgi:hypothetical protein